ncbi:MAG TPA: phenylacetate--CoA ligase family protein [Thermoplasmatales archaeon]|nr:phenylacetate--CoA ligase family protein [Thermoplasmatales archaeon]
MRINDIFKLVSAYILERDLDRRLDVKEIHRYQDKKFRKIFKIAMKTRFYRDMYRDMIDFSRNLTLDDLGVLPLIGRENIMKAHLKDLIPEGFRGNIFKVSTSGSTGKPLILLNDEFTALRCLLAFADELRAHGIDWRKDKISIIGDFSFLGPEHNYMKIFSSFFPIPKKNFQLLDVGMSIKSIMSELEKFRPDFLGGYPPIIKGLSYLKKLGMGEKLQPRVIATSGSYLDNSTKRVIRDAFDANLFDSYSSAEAGAIAHQCEEGNYHIHPELLYIEVLDDHGMRVSDGEEGYIVVTKLYGNVSPLIRYKGLGDRVKLIGVGCECGRKSIIISDIRGRRVDPIITKDHKLISPFAITRILCEFADKGLKLEGFHILQKHIDEIEIFLDAEDPDIEMIRELEKSLSRILGGVKINIKFVKHLKKNIPLVESKVDYEALVC